MLVNENFDLKQLRHDYVRKNVLASVTSCYNKTKEYRLLASYLTEYYYEVYSLLLSAINDNNELVERKNYNLKAKIKATVNCNKTGVLSTLEKSLRSYFIKIKDSRNVGSKKIESKSMDQLILYDENIEVALDAIGQTHTLSGYIYRLIEIYNVSVLDLALYLNMFESSVMIEYLQIKKSIMEYISKTCKSKQETTQKYPYVMEEKQVYTLSDEVKKEYMKRKNKGNLIFDVK